ncbi:hypothetical protein DIPPA_26546 [Diplonema papillatum]|nr:hypothetical protein DIPPA_26546 [Diplonema papillatum]
MEVINWLHSVATTHPVATVRSALAACEGDARRAHVARFFAAVAPAAADTSVAARLFSEQKRRFVALEAENATLHVQVDALQERLVDAVASCCALEDRLAEAADDRRLLEEKCKAIEAQLSQFAKPDTSSHVPARDSQAGRDAPAVSWFGSLAEMLRQVSSERKAIKSSLVAAQRQATERNAAAPGGAGEEQTFERLYHHAAEHLSALEREAALLRFENAALRDQAPFESALHGRQPDGPGPSTAVDGDANARPSESGRNGGSKGLEADTLHARVRSRGSHRDYLDGFSRRNIDAEVGSGSPQDGGDPALRAVVDVQTAALCEAEHAKERLAMEVDTLQQQLIDATAYVETVEDEHEREITELKLSAAREMAAHKQRIAALQHQLAVHVGGPLPARPESVTENRPAASPPTRKGPAPCRPSLGEPGNPPAASNASSASSSSRSGEDLRNDAWSPPASTPRKPPRRGSESVSAGGGGRPPPAARTDASSSSEEGGGPAAAGPRSAEAEGGWWAPRTPGTAQKMGVPRNRGGQQAGGQHPPARSAPPVLKASRRLAHDGAWLRTLALALGPEDPARRGFDEAALVAFEEKVRAYARPAKRRSPPAAAALSSASSSSSSARENVERQRKQLSAQADMLQEQVLGATERLVAAEEDRGALRGERDQAAILAENPPRSEAARSTRPAEATAKTFLTFSPSLETSTNNNDPRSEEERQGGAAQQAALAYLVDDMQQQLIDATEKLSSMEEECDDRRDEAERALRREKGKVGDLRRILAEKEALLLLRAGPGSEDAKESDQAALAYLVEDMQQQLIDATERLASMEEESDARRESGERALHAEKEKVENLRRDLAREKALRPPAAGKQPDAPDAAAMAYLVEDMQQQLIDATALIDTLQESSDEGEADSRSPPRATVPRGSKPESDAAELVAALLSKLQEAHDECAVLKSERAAALASRALKEDGSSAEALREELVAARAQLAQQQGRLRWTELALTRKLVAPAIAAVRPASDAPTPSFVGLLRKVEALENERLTLRMEVDTLQQRLIDSVAHSTVFSFFYCQY